MLRLSSLQAFDVNTGTLVMMVIMTIILVYMLVVGRFPATKTLRGGIQELKFRVTEVEENERKLKAANADLHNVMRVIAAQNTELTSRVKALEGQLRSTTEERDTLRTRNSHLEYLLNNPRQVSGAEPGNELRTALTTLFSVVELQALCADLGASYEDMEGDGKTAKALGIIAHFQRRGELAQLIAAVKERRPRTQL